MDNKEILEKIKIINDMLKDISEELNQNEDIDDYEIELETFEFSSIEHFRTQKKYKITLKCLQKIG